MSEAQKYRKKPVVIETMEWDGSDATSLAIRHWVEPAAAVVDTDHIQHLWSYDAGCYILPSGKTVFAPYRTRCLIILTLEGEMIAKPGWRIIRGVRSEFYPCDPDIFAATYDFVSPITDFYADLEDAIGNMGDDFSTDMNEDGDQISVSIADGREYVVTVLVSE